MRIACVIIIVAIAGCSDDGPTGEQWTWSLPAGFPEPRVPVDNPMSTQKVELGRFLFYDTRLSGNGTQACASCHVQEHAFTDGRVTPLGSTGEPGRHNAMSLVNVAYNATQTWANNAITELEMQALVPMFGEHPVELGLAGKEAELLDRLRDEPTYAELFPSAFPEAEPFTISNVAKAIASFERTIISGGSRYDRFTAGDLSALSPAEQRGFDIFNSENLQCHHCHGSFNFTTSFEHTNTPAGGFIQFENTALYNIDGLGAYPADDPGLYELTGNPQEMGRFKPVTLRNIMLTAPYMHDGSMTTLDEVIDAYARGGRLITSGPNAGDGKTSPLKSLFLGGFTLSPEERADLLSFFPALSDEAIITDPSLANPWAP